MGGGGNYGYTVVFSPEGRGAERVAGEHSQALKGEARRVHLGTGGLVHLCGTQAFHTTTELLIDHFG